MILLKRFLLMVQFLTTIPLPINLDVKEEDFGKGLIFAPTVGLIIGGILAFSYHFLNKALPVSITSVFIVILYILLTGGLHLDGLGDTFDGLFSNRSRERMLEIMRDSRVGTNAVLAIVCVLLLNIFVLMEINSMYIIKTLILMPVAGRIGSLIGSGISIYARRGEGLGKSFIDYCGFKEVGFGTIIYILIFYAIAGSTGLIIALVPVISATLSVRLFSRKIGGATGDILGAVCELNQTVFLLSMCMVQLYGFIV